MVFVHTLLVLCQSAAWQNGSVWATWQKWFSLVG